ncbi:protein of unknown function [Pararobbsia alpina]
MGLIGSNSRLFQFIPENPRIGPANAKYISGIPRAPGKLPLDTDDHYSFTFSQAGTFKYFCSIHSHMTGTVIVK